MTTSVYQLIITHHKQSETLSLDKNQSRKIRAKHNTNYKVMKDGKLVEDVIAKKVGDDLYVYLADEETPMVVLEAYYDYAPITDAQTLEQMAVNFATTSETAPFVPVALEELGAVVLGLSSIGAMTMAKRNKNKNTSTADVSDTDDNAHNTNTSDASATSTDGNQDNANNTDGNANTGGNTSTNDNPVNNHDADADNDTHTEDDTESNSGDMDGDSVDNNSNDADAGGTNGSTDVGADTNDNSVNEDADNSNNATNTDADNDVDDNSATNNGDNESGDTNNPDDVTDDANGGNNTDDTSGDDDNTDGNVDNPTNPDDAGGSEDATTDNNGTTDGTNGGSDSDDADSTDDNSDHTTDNGSSDTNDSGDNSDNTNDDSANGSDDTGNTNDDTNTDTDDESGDADGVTDDQTDGNDDLGNRPDDGSDGADNNGGDTDTDNNSDSTTNDSEDNTDTDGTTDSTNDGSSTTDGTSDNGSDSDNTDGANNNSDNATDNSSGDTDDNSGNTDGATDGSNNTDNTDGSTNADDTDTNGNSDNTDNSSDNSSDNTNTDSDNTDNPPAKSSVTINPIDDGLINQAESRGSFVLSGAITLADGAASPSVTVSINGEEKPAQISDDGKSWRLSVAGSELAKNQGEQTATVKLTTQENGTTATTENTTTYKVNTEIKQPVISFNKIAEDDVINLVESKQQAVKISGNVTNTQAGDKVMLTIGEAVSEVEIGANGEFELLVSSETLINHRSVSAKVVTKDEVGNIATTSETKAYQVDLDPPTPLISLDKITGDNFISIPELMAVTPASPNFTLTGRISDLEATDTKTVTLTLCGCSSCAEARKVLKATLEADGSFKADVDAMELTQYSKVIATVSSSDKAGNVAEDVSTSQSFTNQLNPVAPTIELDPIARDNFVNSAESSGKIKITGRLENVPESALKAQKVVKMQFIKAGQVVAEKDVPFDLNQASNLAEKPPLPSFTYELDGTELQNYDKVSVTFTNRDRKTYTTEQSYVYAAFPPAWGSVSLTGVSSDNVIDGNDTKELTSIVRGTYTANANLNAPAGVGVYVDVMIHVNGKIYTKRVDGMSGTFEVAVPTRELIADQDKAITVTATLNDTAGNTAGNKTGRISYQVKDTEITTPDIEIDSLATINAVYQEKNPTTRISGKLSKVDGDIPEGNQTVTATVGGRDYKAIVQDGKWFVDVATSELVAANGNVSAKVAVKDLSGNTAQNSASKAYVVDVTPPKVAIELNKVGDDNVLSATELNGEVVVSGKVNGDYQPTDKVKLQIGSATYEVAIQDGTFSQVVSTDVLRVNSKVLASLESCDEAGNVGTAEDTQDYQVQAVDIQINFANVTTDNLINVTERSAQSVTVSGTLSGNDVGLAKSVLLTINGVQYTAELTGTTFSVNVSGNDLLNNSDYRIQAQVLDSQLQVQATKAHQYEVQDRAAADIHITNVGDDALSADQVFGGVRVSGKLNFNDSLYQQGFNSDKLKTLKVTIGEKEYAAGFNREDFSFHFDVTREEYASLVGKPVSYKFVTDVTHHMYYLSGTDTQKTINMLDAKNNAHKEIMAAELAKISVEFDAKTIVSNTVVAVKQQTLVSGEVSGTAKAGDTVEIALGDKTYTGTVGQNLHFNINVDNADLSKLSGNKLTATLHTKDLSGKAIVVNDVAEISLTDNVKSDFVNPHQYMQHNTRVFHHSDPNYDHPYFLHIMSPTGSDRGGFLAKMPLGGYNTNNPANPLEPVEIKYYFMKNSDYDKPNGYRHNEISNRDAYREFTPELIGLIKKTYDTFNAVSNVRFVEASSEAEADTKIIYVNYDMRNPGSTLGGAAGIGENGGNVIMNSGTNGFGSGYWNYNDYTAFHEIYHTLSAKHTDDAFSMLRNGDRKYYAVGEDNSSEFSIMSGKMWDYHMAHDLSGFSIYDLAFMHYRFGVNQTVRAGNDVYGFNHYASQVQDGTIYIWDGAGVDTFDASYEKEGVLVNLTPGSWNYYRSQFSDTLVVKEQVNISAYDYASYFAEQNLDGVSVNGTLGNGYAHKVLTKGQSFIGHGTQIENLNGSKFADILIGNKADNNISGGAGNDKIYGAEGNDYLDGGLGADEMEGGTGNDRYVVDNTGDKVIEKADGGDADSVYSSITYTLPENVEHLYLIGNGNIDATGNNLNNTIVGNDGNNILRGEGGDDVLDGGRGNDTLIGGAGADTFRFSSVLDGSVDKIEGFVVNEDKIQLDKSIFSAVTDTTVRNHILYDSTTGELSYDADGSGIVNAIHFATLDAGLDAMAIRYEII